MFRGVIIFTPSKRHVGSPGQVTTPVFSGEVDSSAGNVRTNMWIVLELVQALLYSSSRYVHTLLSYAPRISPHTAVSAF